MADATDIEAGTNANNSAVQAPLNTNGIDTSTENKKVTFADVVRTTTV